jgi:hypothetical protein
MSSTKVEENEVNNNQTSKKDSSKFRGGSKALKRDFISSEDYAEKRKNALESPADQNDKNKMIQGDLKNLIGDFNKNTRELQGRDAIWDEQNLAVALGRNVKMSQFKGFRENYRKLNEIVSRDDIIPQNKQAIVNEIYTIRENLALNNKAYEALESSSNALSFSELDKDYLDEAFQMNIDYLNSFARNISEKLQEEKSLDANFINQNAKNNAVESAFSKSNVKITTQKYGKFLQKKFSELNNSIKNEFDLQNAAFRNKKDLFAGLGKDDKAKLKSIQDFTQANNELQTKTLKLAKLRDTRIDQILERIDEISEEKKKMTKYEKSIKPLSTGDPNQRKNLENTKSENNQKLKKFDSEIEALKKEVKGIYKLATGENPAREAEQKKDKIVIKKVTQSENQDRDIKYIRSMLGDKNGKNPVKEGLNKKIKENQEIIKKNKPTQDEIDQQSKSIRKYLQENANLLKQKDSSRLQLAEENKEKGVINRGVIGLIKSNLGLGDKADSSINPFKVNQAHVDNKSSKHTIKSNNTKIKEIIKGDKFKNINIEKDAIKQAKDQNKKLDEELGFQERNPFNKTKKNPFLGVMDKIANSVDKAALKVNTLIDKKLHSDRDIETDKEIAKNQERSNLKKDIAVGAAVGIAASPLIAAVGAAASPFLAAGALGFGAFKAGEAAVGGIKQLKQKHEEKKDEKSVKSEHKKDRSLYDKDGNEVFTKKEVRIDKTLEENGLKLMKNGEEIKFDKGPALNIIREALKKGQINENGEISYKGKSSGYKIEMNQERNDLAENLEDRINSFKDEMKGKDKGQELKAF